VQAGSAINLLVIIDVLSMQVSAPRESFKIDPEVGQLLKDAGLHCIATDSGVFSSMEYDLLQMLPEVRVWCPLPRTLCAHNGPSVHIDAQPVGLFCLVGGISHLPMSSVG
jgi:hypothetical protein